MIPLKYRNRSDIFRTGQYSLVDFPQHNNIVICTYSSIFACNFRFRRSWETYTWLLCFSTHVSVLQYNLISITWFFLQMAFDEIVANWSKLTAVNSRVSDLTLNLMCHIIRSETITEVNNLFGAKREISIHMYVCSWGLKSLNATESFVIDWWLL